MTALPRHLFPRSLLQIAEYCGDSVMLKLLEAFGGVHLHVPENIPAGHRLAIILGADADKLAAAFGGETLFIPKADAARRAARDAVIRADRAEGASLSEIAIRHGLTERQIGSICASRHNDNNPDLFGNSSDII
jgi:hypothetical protein